MYWLASYPKSGNTWFRVFISNLLSSESAAVSINALIPLGQANSRDGIDAVLGFCSGDLYQDEMQALRPSVYAWQQKNLTNTCYMKTHDACERVASGDLVICQQATAGALYLIRNPLDIAVSYANHRSCSVDSAIDCLNDPHHCLAEHDSTKQKKQIEQRLLSWSMHVESWLDTPEVETMPVRYEDMLATPQETFTKAAAFLRLPTDRDTINQAIRNSSFQGLRKQEESSPFRERPPRVSRFFRSGSAGGWRTDLSTKQVDRIIREHESVMHRFGYLDDKGNSTLF